LNVYNIGRRIHELENELDGEQRRLGDSTKNLRKSERRLKELEFQGSILQNSVADKILDKYLPKKRYEVTLSILETNLGFQDTLKAIYLM
jgi:hypothetical protein